MNRLSNSPIKKENIYHVYDYYDEPIVYSFLNETGSLFLAIFVDYEEDDTETWLYLPISFKELRDIETGKRSLRNLVLKPKSAFVYIEKQSDNKSCFFVESTNCINARFLPDEDSYIKYESSEMINNKSLYSATTSDNRYTVDVSFSSDKEEYEMPAVLLAKILIDFQRLLTALSLNKDAKRIPNKSNDELNFVGTFAGSFGIRLLSDKISSLINGDESEPYKKIVRLFGMTNDNIKFKPDEIIEEYGWLVLKHFSRLSKNFLNLKGGKIESGIPQPGFGVEKFSASFNSKKVNNFIDNLSTSAVEVNQQNITLKGTLTKYDSMKRQFSFVSDEGKLFSGTVNTQKQSFIIPAKGTAKITVKLTENKLEDTVEKKIGLSFWEPAM